MNLFRNMPTMLFVLLLLACPGNAKADDACTPEKEALHQPEPDNFVQEELYGKRRQKMAKLDKNCDGVIDEREWASVILDLFQAADLDHDNSLSADEQHAMMDEYTARTEKIIGATKIIQSREIQTALRVMDANRNGIVTVDEFVGYYAAIFKRMDKNGDNVIDINEFDEGFEGIRRIHN